MLACWLGVASVLIWTCVALALCVILYALYLSFTIPKPPPLPRGGLRTVRTGPPPRQEWDRIERKAA